MIGGGSVPQQQPGRFNLAAVTGHHQRRAFIHVMTIHDGAACDQGFDDLQLTGHGRCVQWQAAVSIVVSLIDHSGIGPDHSLNARQITDFDSLVDIAGGRRGGHQDQDQIKCPLTQ